MGETGINLSKEKEKHARKIAECRKTNKHLRPPHTKLKFIDTADIDKRRFPRNKATGSGEPGGGPITGYIGDSGPATVLQY